MVREWCLFQLRDGSLFMKIYSLTELNENARVQGHYTFHVTAIFIWFLIKHCTQAEKMQDGFKGSDTELRDISIFGLK